MNPGMQNPLPPHLFVAGVVKPPGTAKKKKDKSTEKDKDGFFFLGWKKLIGDISLRRLTNIFQLRREQNAERKAILMEKCTMAYIVAAELKYPLH